MNPKVEAILKLIQMLHQRGVFAAYHVGWGPPFRDGAISVFPTHESIGVDVLWGDNAFYFWLKDEYLDEIIQYLDKVDKETSPAEAHE